MTQTSPTPHSETPETPDETPNEAQNIPPPQEVEAGDALARAETALAALVAEVDVLNGQVKTLTDRLLLAHADLDNQRKQGEREKKETAKYAISKFAADVVTSGDSFQHAINAVSVESAEKDPALAGFLQGVVLAERQFLAVLEKYGIVQINPKGEPFNPNLHHAAGQETRTDIPTGTVVRVYQVGYKIEDRVLRSAMVVVSAGGPKVGKKPEADAKVAEPAEVTSSQTPEPAPEPPTTSDPDSAKDDAKSATKSQTGQQETAKDNDSKEV